MRNDDPYDRASGTGNSPLGGSGYGAAGGMGGAGAGAPTGGVSGQHGESTTERVRESFDQARETARETAHEAGEKAHEFRYNMADKLDTGAQRLRERASRMGTGTEDGPLHRALDSDAAHRVERGLADGMENTAEWIRKADIESVRTGIERQVREHPGRTLLVALGIGYLIGRTFGGGEKEGREESKTAGTGTTTGDDRTKGDFGASSSGHGLH